MSGPALAFAMDPARTRHVLPPELIERLSKVCDILDLRPLVDFGDERARDILRRAEILITGWGSPAITAETVLTATNLRLIAHAAGTVKHFIAPEAYAAGIAVTHAADANAVPVAEYTLAAILFANKRVFELRDVYRRDHGRTAADVLLDEPIGNFRRTVGLVGASRIGRKVAKLLESFDVEVLMVDPFVHPDDPIAHSTELVGLPELLRRSDVVSIHTPSLPSTRRMIAAEELRLMRDGTTLINTARGALIDEAALLAELKSGRISAVIDVTEPDIPAPDSPLYELPNVFLTPHIAGAAGTERTRLGAVAVEEVERFVAGLPLRFAIDPAMLERIA